MNQSTHNQLISFIWSVADDCLRDIYNRGKYRDVILPMVVLRRLDVLLEPTKDKVKAEIAFQKNELELTELDPSGLKDASGYVFYNTSDFTLQRLKSTATNSKKILEKNFLDYLDGFSDNVNEIISRFKLRDQVRHMADKDILLKVLEKFTSESINISPKDTTDPDGNVLPALTNLGMGYVFEELIRKFNEENNEEAGEHFTPREVIKLMTQITIAPVKDQLPPAITLYDPACGSGGMLTEAENFIHDINPNIKAYLYGKEVNDETYAICKSDMMIKGDNPENIRIGSTLATDEFAGETFHFMLSNPPYGKAWGNDEEYIKDDKKKEVIDPRFKLTLNDYWQTPQSEKATPRTSDGQLLFLMEMVSKLKSTQHSSFGSRIASVHNGSSLFTGDAGSGESNIRRYIIENDLLECIIQLPNNLFYNTGITTYIWLLTNHKADHRKGKVQLIDANLVYQKLRKNLGAKNCEFSDAHISQISQAYNDFADITRQKDSDNNPIGLASKVFDNSDFGYYKVTIERPDRRATQFSHEAISQLRFDSKMSDAMQAVYNNHGDDLYQADFLSTHSDDIKTLLEQESIELKPKDEKNLLSLKHWQKYQAIYDKAKLLCDAMLEKLGSGVIKDFNQVWKASDTFFKALQKEQSIKTNATEKKTILNAISWYDETAEKVIAKTKTFKDAELDELLAELGCDKADLPNFGYYPTGNTANGKANEYHLYESNSDLRDAESIPLTQNIQDYYLAEVKPHVDEAWIDLSSVKIGYEISFNKYFYEHKPLRELGVVADEMLALEQQAEGLIAEILGLSNTELQNTGLQTGQSK